MGLAFSLQAEQAALHARIDKEDGAYRVRPSAPTGRYHRAPEPAAVEAYQAAMATWEAAFPLTAAYEKAINRSRIARDNRWQAEKMMQHFQKLLAAKYLGQDLIKVVL